ncbi:MAG: hypothetical protein LCH37_15300 [Bacteroidetes bacterium]|nr:hypothetical protein [Bacteroidota bacterium]
MNQQNRDLDPTDATFRLQAYFKPGGKYKSYKWNANWLFDYYRVTRGAQLPYPLDAIYRKIEEIHTNCTRLLVYDNRPTTQFPVMIEMVNGRVVTDNRPPQEKIRRPLKLY